MGDVVKSMSTDVPDFCFFNKMEMIWMGGSEQEFRLLSGKKTTHSRRPYMIELNIWMFPKIGVPQNG